MKRYWFIILSLIVFEGFSQSTEFENKFSQAERYYNRGDYNRAERLMLDCYRMDSTVVDLLIKMNQLSVKQQKWKRVALLSRKLQRILPVEASKYHQQEVLSYFYLQDYEKADKTLKACLKKHKMHSFDASKCERLANNIAFAKEAVKNPVPYKPINLGKLINSEYAEYLPNLTQDGRYLIYTRMVSLSRSFPSLQEDFFISKNSNENWIKSVPLSKTINTKKNEGAPSISADGTILYFAACMRKEGLGKCDIYYSYNRGNYWTTPKNLKSINTKYWESQPNLSADGRHLYFVSNRPGGFGKKDLWAVDIAVDGTFGEPYNLGENINTEYDEMSPFLHFDNQTLYFSSDGWPGMGSKDIFVCRKQNDESWSLPENLGYPINSVETDNSFFVDASGETAYFSSKREGGYGKEDIYKFSLYKKVRPQKTGYYKAVVMDAKTQKKLNVKFEIRNVNDSSDVHLKEARNGSVSVGLIANQQYIISAFADGYLYYSSTIDSITEDSLSLIQDEIFLKPVAKDQFFELKNIEFDFDKASLKYASLKELDLFASYLKVNPRMKICIEGHTDNVGTDTYNLKLSQERAEAVKTYLIQKNIPSEYIQAKGFGASQLISKDRNHQDRNRRVVIRILE